MQSFAKRLAGATAALGAACLLVSSVAGPVAAQKKKSKSIQTEAQWVAYDADEARVTVKVKKAGRGNKDKGVRTGKKVEFNVRAAGSILVRTTVAINGRKGELVDIPAGKTVNVYWVPDEAKSTGRFARKIDMILSDAELDELYGVD